MLPHLLECLLLVQLTTSSILIRCQYQVFSYLSSHMRSLYTYDVYLGRTRMMDVSSETEMRMGIQTYQAVLRQYSRQILPPAHPVSTTPDWYSFLSFYLCSSPS